MGRKRSLKCGAEQYRSTSKKICFSEMRDRVKKQKPRKKIVSRLSRVKQKRSNTSSNSLPVKQSFKSMECNEHITEHESLSSHIFRQPDVSDVDIYSLELRRLNMVSYCGTTAVIVPNFNVDRKCIVENQFCLVFRTPHLCEDKNDWLLTCSCSINCFSSQRLLSTVIRSTYAELETQFPSCVHVLSVRPMFETKDAMEDMSVEDFIVNDSLREEEQSFQGVYPMHQEDMFCVITKKDFAVVKSGKCTKCHFSNCDHLKEFMSDCDIDSRTPSTKRKLPQPKSWRSISFETASHIKQYNREGINTAERVNTRDLVFDEPRICRSCQVTAINKDDYLDLKLFTSTEIIKCKVQHQTCPSCDNQVDFDGHDYGVLNMGKFLICHFILRSYLHRFKHGNCPLHTFYQSLADDLRQCGFDNFKQQLNYQDFIASWYGYLELLDIDFDSGFSCPQCKGNPEVVICDGTSLAFRKNMLIDRLPGFQPEDNKVVYVMYY